LRWGIADVEAWLETLEPHVISWWMVFRGVRPECFDLPAPKRQDMTAKHGRLMTADEALAKATGRSR